MKEVVWVFGSSGAGKETFIGRALQDEELLSRFGWTRNLIAACQESLEFIPSDELLEAEREKILDRVPQLLTVVDVVLIKWQGVDSLAARPQRLQETVPKARHRVILLQASKQEQVKRLAAKPWWHDYGNEERYIDTEQNTVAGYLAQLVVNFDVTVLASGEDDDYRSL